MTIPLELVEYESGEVWELDKGKPLLAGRSREADIILVDPDCSRRQFEILVSDNHVLLSALSESVPTFCDDSRAKSHVSLKAGSVISVGRTRLEVRSVGAAYSSSKSVAPASSSQQFPERLPANESPPVLKTPGVDEQGLLTQAIRIETMEEFPSLPVNDMFCSSIATATDLARAVRVTGDISIGRDEECSVCLPHIQVSRKHASLQHRGNCTILRDLKSANGTYVNGLRIQIPVTLTPGARIGIGPYQLSWTGDSLVPTTRTDNLQLEGRKLTRRVPRRDSSGSIAILDNVSVVVRPHEFVCLLGPTGSGKSTLLAALSARTPANSGQVLINQSDLYDEFESLKQDIAVVPQHDILHDELTLNEALTYTARLRLPRDTSTQEMQTEITAITEQLGLSGVRQTTLRNMSGGQRRRASLANELLARPNLLFLDEVTSGLDELTDRQMMRLFRNIADAGKTVVCVTHTLANIEDCCHLVVLLTVGGKLAFVGTPAEVFDYFKISRLSDVYEILADASRATSLQSKFEASPIYDRYVRNRLSPGAIPEERENELSERQFLQNQFVTMQHQLPLLLDRYFKVFTTDRRSLTGLALQVSVVATVSYLVFGNVAPAAQATSAELFRHASESCNVLFVLAVSCFWFGCNNSVREIVKERPIYSRELLVNLSPGSFYISKFALQFLVAATQSILLLAAVDFCCSLPGSLFMQVVILTVAAAAGVAVGLCLSSIAITQEIALTLVPLVLIPQIILSDVFVELEGLSRWLGGMFVANYWVYGLLRGTLPDNLVDQLNAPLAAPLQFVPGAVALTLQVFTLASFSIGVLHIRDRIMACSNKTLKQAISELPFVGKYVSQIVTAVRQRFEKGLRRTC